MSDHTDNNPIVRKARRSNGFRRRITERALGYPGQLIQEFLELKGAELIIDAGSGSGFYTMELAQWLTHGKILALDSSPDMLRELSRCVLKKKYNRRVEVLECDLCDIPLADDSADGVVSLFVWNRIENLMDASEELFRLAKTGGKVFICDFLQDGAHNINGTDRTSFTPQDMKGVLEKSGFTGVRSFIHNKNLVIGTGIKPV